MKRILILLITVLALSGCRKNSITLNGSVKESKEKFIYISEVDINVPVMIDSSKISAKGTFRFRIKASEPGFYQIGYSDKDYANLLAEPGERIKMNFAGSNLYNDYTVSGSAGSELVKLLDFKLMETKSKLDSLTTVYKNISTEPDFDTKGPLIENEYQAIIKKQRQYTIEFILNHINSLASIKALYQKFNEDTYVLYETRDLQYMKIVSDSLQSHYPDLKLTKALVSDFEREMNRFTTQKLQLATSSLTETKLDPDLKDINGRKIALSSLRGKYVLLAFWSAQSRDCVADNLQLKEFYRAFNTKGFDIYQINLDEDESIWRQAVKFDELPWINTREDDPKNPLNARLYNVKTVPMNYLYDPEGNIIATNLHGRNLQIKLNQIFNN